MGMMCTTINVNDMEDYLTSKELKIKVLIGEEVFSFGLFVGRRRTLDRGGCNRGKRSAESKRKYKCNNCMALFL